jgi:hypothetical protein
VSTGTESVGLSRLRSVDAGVVLSWMAHFVILWVIALAVLAMQCLLATPLFERPRCRLSSTSVMKHL